MDTVTNRITAVMALDTVTMDMDMNMIIMNTATAMGTSVESRLPRGRRFSPTATSQPSKTLNCLFQPDLDLVLQVDMDQQHPPTTSLLLPVTSTHPQSSRTRLQ